MYSEATTLAPHLLAWLLVLALGIALALVTRHLRRCRRDNRLLRSELRNATAANDDLRRSVGEASQQATALQELLCQTTRDHERDLSALTDELGRMQDSRLNLAEQSKLLAAEVDHRMAEWDALRSDLDRAKSDAGQRERRIEELEDLLARNTDTVQDLSQVNNREEHELERLKGELVRSEAALDQLRDEVRQRVQAQTHLERKLRSFRKSFRVVATRH